MQLLDTTKLNGAEFFGLTHPSVQNLVQSCPGAKKCTNYRWIKFEVAKTESAVYKPDESNTCIYYDAFLQMPTNKRGKI